MPSGTPTAALPTQSQKHEKNEDITQLIEDRSALPKYEILDANIIEIAGGDWVSLHILLLDETIFTIDDDAFNETATLFYEKSKSEYGTHSIEQTFYTTVESYEEYKKWNGNHITINCGLIGISVNTSVTEKPSTIRKPGNNYESLCSGSNSGSNSIDKSDKKQVSNPIKNDIDLIVVPENSVLYNRKEWSGWRSIVNTHLRWKQSGCKWSYYTVTPPHCMSGVDREHLVSVKEAHDSGGHTWSKEQKKDFYNDTDNLYVMPSGENRSKGAKDFAEWQPSINVCRYAKEYIEIKKKWNLSVDQVEYNALQRTLQNC